MLGLPFVPPFHKQLPNRYDISTVLANMHRYSPQTKFLFTVDIEPDPQNNFVNHIYFGPTPAGCEAPYV